MPNIFTFFPIMPKLFSFSQLFQFFIVFPLLCQILSFAKIINIG